MKQTVENYTNKQEFDSNITFLFENYSLATNRAVRSEAIAQTRKYMPFINIEDFIITDTKTNINEFYIYIKYSVSSLNVLDELSFVKFISGPITKLFFLKL